MAEARRREQWLQQATDMAHHANLHRDPAQVRTPYTAEDFNPLANRAPRKRYLKVTAKEFVLQLGRSLAGK